MTFCFYCGELVTGQLAAIPLSICCYSCCRDPESTNKKVPKNCEISKFDAERAYSNISDRLDVLNSILRTRAGRNGQRKKRSLFIKKEVQALSAMSVETLMRYKNVDKRYGRRLEFIKDEFSEDWAKISPTVRIYMVLDYIVERPKPEVKLEDLRKRFKVSHRVQEILDKTERAHPEAVLQFCLGNPSGGAKEFQELKDKTNLVFDNLYRKVFYHLTKEELGFFRSAQTPLKDLAEKFANRDSGRLIKGHLVDLVGEEIAEEIMSCPACVRRIKGGGNEKIVAQKLLAFWEEREDMETRKRRLDSKLAEYHLRHCLWKETWRECYSSYINSTEDVDLEETIGVLWMYDELLGKGIPPESAAGESALDEFYYCFDYKQLSLTESVQKAVDAAETTLADKIVHYSFPSTFLDGLEDDYSIPF